MIKTLQFKGIGFLRLFSMLGLPAQHPQLGLEAGGWCHLSGWAQAWLHCPVLPRPRLQHHDGQPVRHAVWGAKWRHGCLAEWIHSGECWMVRCSSWPCPCRGLAVRCTLRPSLQPSQEWHSLRLQSKVSSHSLSHSSPPLTDFVLSSSSSSCWL